MMRFTGHDVEYLQQLFNHLDKEIIPVSAYIDIVWKNSAITAVVDRRSCHNFYLSLHPETGKPLFESECECCTVQYYADDLQDFCCDDCDQAEHDAYEKQVKDAATKGGML